jgi:uncharacterized damage-inducible protein DinB
MKRVAIVLATALLAAAVPAFAQESKEPPKTVSEAVDRTMGGVEGEFVSAAEAMPEEKYTFAPTNGEFKGVRTFAQQVKHVAAVNYVLGSAILGEKPPVDIKGENGPDDMTSKADIVKFLKDSFAYTHKAAQSVNEKNMADLVQNPFGSGKTSRTSLVLIMFGHPFDHYGQMVEYLRMNSIVPPASRGQ